MKDYAANERPELLHIGGIKEVILGAYLPGDVDPDGTTFPMRFEYYDNND